MNFIHVKRPVCELGEACTATEPHHSICSHKGIPDFPALCTAACRQPCGLHVPRVRKNRTCEIKSLNNGIDFEKNQASLLGAAKTSAPTLLPHFLTLAQKFRVSHRCRIDIFKSMLVHGTFFQLLAFFFSPNRCCCQATWSRASTCKDSSIHQLHWLSSRHTHSCNCFCRSCARLARPHPPRDL
jgi:hypothetical protein